MPQSEPPSSTSSGAVLLAAGCTSILGLGLYWLHKRRRKYGTLSGVVSYSSRLIAAHRAVEGSQDHPLFTDPLAASLAGREAVQRARDSYPVGTLCLTQSYGCLSSQQQL